MKRVLIVSIVLTLLYSTMALSGRRLVRPYYRFIEPAATNTTVRIPSKDGRLWAYSLERLGGTDTVSVWYIYGPNQLNHTDSTLYQLPPGVDPSTPRIVDFTVDGPEVPPLGLRVIKVSGTAFIISGGYLK